MTTRFAITSPKPNHQRVSVQPGILLPSGTFTPHGVAQHLDDGQSFDGYVYPGVAFLITEAPRPEPPADPLPGQSAEILRGLERDAGNPPDRVLP